MSDHQCIEFSIQERSQPVNVGRGGMVRSPSWNTKRLSKDKLREHLEETRVHQDQDEFGWARSAGALEDTVRAARQEIARAKEAIRKDGRGGLIEKWQTRWHGDQSGRWTHRLIPELATRLDRKHGQVGFYWRKRYRAMVALMRT